MPATSVAPCAVVPSAEGSVAEGLTRVKGCGREGCVNRLIGQIALCFALFVVTGGHWAVFQCVAWTSMVVEYSQRERSLAKGIEQTFDGGHPCTMCESISKAKQQERSEPLWSSEFHKLEKFVGTVRTLLPLRVARDAWFPDAVILCPPSRADAPTPPVPIRIS